MARMREKGKIKLYTGRTNFVVSASIASMVIIFFGFLFYLTEARRLRQEKYMHLKTVADFKENQILEWRKERMADAFHFSQSPLYIDALSSYLQKPDTSVEKNIISRNRMIKDLRGFESVYIVTNKKINCFLLDTLHTYDDSIVSMYIDSAMLFRKIYFTNFYSNPKKKSVNLAIISPLIDDNKVIAFLIFLIDPGKYFFPVLQTWPTPSKTSETLIVTRGANNVIIINEPRYKENTALNMQIPLTKENMPAVKAVTGYEGKFEGIDYRGARVLSDVRKIPGTPWFMVTKVDKKEIYSEIRFRAIVIMIIVIILILLLISALSWIYNYHKSNIYKELLASTRQLSKIEEEFRITLYSVGDGVITTDLNGLIKRMNREAEQLTGWSENDAQGKPLEEVFRIINEDNRELTASPLRTILRDGMVVGLANHTLLLSKDGREIPIADSGAPIKNDRGEILGIVLVFKDQTKEREAQKALLESQQRMSHIIEFLPDAIFAIDKGGKVIAWNKAIQEMTGVAAKYMIGKDNFEYAIPFFGKRHPVLIDHVFRDYPDIEHNYDMIKREGDTVIAESSICEIAGKRINFFGKASPLYNSSGEIVGAIELIRDITENKKNQALLIEKDLIFQSLMEFSPIYIFFKDHEIRPIYLSRNYEKMVGKPIAEMIGKTMDELFPSDLAKSMMADDKKIINEGKLVMVDEELNGRYYTTIKFPISQKGQRPLLAGFTIDITDRKKAEQELILAKNRAERSDKLKDAFLQNMSHEIRTPMNAIVGFSALLNDNDITPDKIRLYSEIISNSSNQLLSIVDDILTVSRIQTGQEILNINPINIHAILDELMLIFEPRASEKKLNLSLLKPADYNELFIYTDRTKLTQVLTNLISNALKFTHSGTIDFGYERKEDTIEFYVKDTGIGIQPDMQEIIFERFAQADNVNKIYGGTGLGLSISKAYVKIMGGEIIVKSEPGKGSAFFFTIPYKPLEKKVEFAPKSIKSEKHNNKSILIAEDEDYNFQLIREMLINMDYKLFHAKNGLEAINICRDNPEINLVLMDIKMPVIDGVKAMIEIKQLLPDIHILAQTAYALDEEKQKFMKQGFDDYIIKPLKKKELIDKILKYI